MIDAVANPGSTAEHTERRRIAAIVIAKSAAAAAVLATGFRAVSDDDFARVVIAEQWAHHARWDASGTSWLPFPFWIAGATMRVFGRSLETARVLAIVLAIAAALIVYVAARWIDDTPAAALAGALAAAVFPWSARLGVATVPELLTAALTLLAMASLAPTTDRTRRRSIAAAGLVAATLSRYEAWPVAIAFAAVCIADSARSSTARARSLGVAALALVGPAAWIAWNRIAHGDALHFLARVAAYRHALGSNEGGAAMRLVAYPEAMVRQEPEIVVLFVAAVAVTALAGRDALVARLSPYARPALMALVQIAALSAAMIKDGAPTHHPERATLAALLLIAIAGAALAVHALRDRRRRIAKALVLAGALAIGVALRARWPSEGFVARSDEVAVGRAAREASRPGEPLLIEVADYGYLAVTAALGRPEDAIADRSVDPRDAKTASSFDDAASIRRRVSATGARWVAARLTDPVRDALGAPRSQHGAWGLFRVERAP